MKIVRLNNQTQIPILGFGTWQLQGAFCRQAVQKALEVGFRLIDTADAYGNHKEVARAIKKSNIPRSEIFLTTKVWWPNLTQTAIEKSALRFLKELETDYIDLLLIHWPNRQIPIEQSLKALKNLQDRGVIRAFGVSNFTIHHLDDILKTGISITNNQIELHPSFSQPELVNFCQSHNIAVTAYSPIGQGQDLKLAEIQDLASKYGSTTSRVILSWLIHKNIIAIPRSSNPEHIEDNFKAIELELSPEDIARIDQLNTGNRQVKPSFSDFDY